MPKRILSKDEQHLLMTRLLPEIIESYRSINSMVNTLTDDWKPTEKQAPALTNTQLVSLLQKMTSETDDILAACEALKSELGTIIERIETDRNISV